MRVAPVVAALVFVLPATLAGQPKGQRLTDELILRAEDTVEKIILTRWYVNDSMTAYNKLIDGSEEPRTAHKKLTKKVAKTEKQLAKTRRSVDWMESTAKSFFDDWAASLERMSDETLRTTAMGRMSGTRDRYDEILVLGRQARDDFDAFNSLLKDQLVFTEHDLNPAGLEALRADSDRMNGQAEDLRRKIDRTVMTAKRYIESLRPE